MTVRWCNMLLFDAGMLCNHCDLETLLIGLDWLCIMLFVQSLSEKTMRLNHLILNKVMLITVYMHCKWKLCLCFVLYDCSDLHLVFSDLEPIVSVMIICSYLLTSIHLIENDNYQCVLKFCSLHFFSHTNIYAPHKIVGGD